MKKTTFRLGSSRDGFIRTTLSPVGEQEPRAFGAIDGLLLFCLLGGCVILARIFIAH